MSNKGSERDPLVDPKPGDVIKFAWYWRPLEIAEVSNELIRVWNSTRSTKMALCTPNNFHKQCLHAEVIHAH